MSATPTTPNDKRSIIRDKEAKIRAILDATHALIGTKGYDRVTIKDIAASAGVSVGLIYLYFPNGKLDIVKEIPSRNVEKYLIEQPEIIDFNDFPGYMRAVITNMQRSTEENSALVKASISAALRDSGIAEGFRKLDLEDYSAISKLFVRFEGVNIDDANSLKLVMNWGVMVKSIILYNTIYPMVLTDEEALIDLMIDLSLKMWGYRKKP
ncbi:MAG TPA: helix-turn-helix domain-containing protein [Candidatus Acidoferrales bacterium]|nr:helix-turn-helix domain-containing protein [Candidatus Acidoferrales bacterium]